MSPTFALSIETSTRMGGVALATWKSGGNELGPVAQKLLPAQAPHASLLLPLVEELLRHEGAGPRQIGLICVGIGPGSYTGLRVGIATALTLAQAGKIPVVAVPSLAAVAQQSGQTGSLAVWANAYGGEIYLAIYRKDEQTVCETAPVRLVPASELAANVPQGTILLPETAASPSTVLELGAKLFATRGADAPERVRPLYLRPSRAEIQFQG